MRVITGTDDIWCRWMLKRRYGGDELMLRRAIDWMMPIRRRVLDAADIAVGDTVFDIGCGDGLLGFGALDLVGHRGTVIFGDRQPELAETRAGAVDAGVTDRCRFVVDSLPDLAATPDRSTDVVVTRSALSNVNTVNKQDALAAMFRVLRPDGRLSMYEPIKRHDMSEQPTQLFGIDVSDCLRAAAKIKAAYRASARSNPHVDFDERDLLDYAERAGFTEIRLELVVDRNSRIGQLPHTWEMLLTSSPSPGMPSVAAVLDQVLDDAERTTLERSVRPQIEAGLIRCRTAAAYLHALRPG